MPRIPLSSADLKKISFDDIRSRPGCEGVGDIEIIHLTFPSAQPNWSLRITDAGTAKRDLLQLTALTVQQHLGKRFTLIVPRTPEGSQRACGT